MELIMQNHSTSLNELMENSKELDEITPIFEKEQLDKTLERQLFGSGKYTMHKYIPTVKVKKHTDESAARLKLDINS